MSSDGKELSAEARLENLNHMVGSRVHELNNILGIVLTQCYIAKEGLLSPQQAQDALLQIDSVCRRATTLCRQLLSAVSPHETQRALEPAVKPAPCVTKTPDALDPAQHLVLLVDDKHMQRNIGKALLTTMGFRVLTAQHGSEALKMYREQPEAFTLVVMDAVMPVMNGVETYHQLRKIAPTLPIVFCSGHGQQLVAEVIAADNLTRYLQKPYHPDELWAAMMAFEKLTN
jgi:CheY-like chemotaxis protein